MALAVLAASIVFIIVSIVVLKLHPFVALSLAAILVGLLSPRPLMESEIERAQRKLRAELAVELDNGAVSPQAMEERLEGVRWQVTSSMRAPRAIQAVELAARGFGATAGSIGLVIVFAAIIGQALLESGAADRIVRSTLSLLGERRVATSLAGSGYLLSVPVFFDTVFLLLVPLARSLRARTGAHYVLYIMAIITGSFLTHSLVPPTPGPLIMADTLNLDLGVAIAGGFLLGLIPAALGLWLSRFVDARLDVPLREVTGSSVEEIEAVTRRDKDDLPGLFAALLPVLFPVLLITGHSVASTFSTSTVGSSWAWLTGLSGFFGNKNVALLLGAFCAVSVLRRAQKLSLAELAFKLEPAITSAGVIILITSAGGAFGSMLSRIGIDASLSRWSAPGPDEAPGGVAILLMAWAVAAMMKIAQGSGTVSIITTAGIMASIVPETAQLPFHMLYVYAAIGFGSGFVSWMNDSGFWVVCKMSGFTERETLSTWSLLLAVFAVIGLAQVLLLSQLLPLV